VGYEPPCGEGLGEDSGGEERASFEGVEVWREAEAEGDADGVDDVDDERVAGADEPSVDGLTVGVVGVAEGGVVVAVAGVEVVVVGEGGVEAQVLDRAVAGELDRPEPYP
jgi:hypothetical protein